jgi:hypothetical protein
MSAYEPKPAFLAARTLTTMLGGFRFQQRLNAGSADDYVLAFVRGDERRIVAWTTSSTRRRLTIPAATGQFSITTMAGADAGRIHSNQDALTIDVGTTPIFLAPSR